jgi:uncharacterized protein YdhG (YjbR/CyaY superfamily)
VNLAQYGGEGALKLPDRGCVARLPSIPRVFRRMKKGEPANRRSAAATHRSPRTIDEYLAGVPKPARSTLQKIRAAVRSAVPATATETISYGMPAFKHKRVLVWFAAFSDHCSFFPTASVIDTFKDELKGFSISKGTIRFPADKPPSAALIRKMVKARLKQCDSAEP